MLVKVGLTQRQTLILLHCINWTYFCSTKLFLV